MRRSALAIACLVLAAVLAAPGAGAERAPDDLRDPPEDAIRTESGLIFLVLAEGSGERRPTRDDSVEVRYVGWDRYGRTIARSPERRPDRLTVAELIPGWAEAIRTMTPGEKRRIWIPEPLAYDGRHGKPAGTLVFDLELVRILSPAR